MLSIDINLDSPVRIALQLQAFTLAPETVWLCVNASTARVYNE